MPPPYTVDDYRKATTVLGGDYRKPLLDADASAPPPDNYKYLQASSGSVQEAKPERRPLTFEQKFNWFLIMFLSLLGTMAWQIPGPLMIYLQSEFFNKDPVHGACISRAQTDTPGCKQALSTISLVSGFFSTGSGILAFFLSPVIGKLSDTYGRRRILLLCYFYSVLSNAVLFLGQTPIMSHLPWLWIYYSLNIVNLWGGIGNAYLADVMPPEWRSLAFGINSSIFGMASALGPAINLIPFPGTEPGAINYAWPFGITASLNLCQLLIGSCFLRETLAPENRVPFDRSAFNPFGQMGILWTGPTNISDRRFFRRLAFTVFIQGIGMNGCFLVTGFYVKSQFAISKDMNTLMQVTQGVSALFVMWVLYNPLIRFLGERRVIILGLFINFLFFVGYLFLVTSLVWVFLFTAVGMVGSASSNDRADSLCLGPLLSCPSLLCRQWSTSRPSPA